MNCPYTWKTGWQKPWQIACGGTEVPCQVSEKWYIMVLNLDENRYYYYCFNEDVFKTEKEFENILNVMQKGLSFAKRWNEKQKK